MNFEQLISALAASDALSIIIKATAAIALAMTAMFLARSYSAAVRHLIAAALFAFLFLLPLGSMILPAAEVAVNLDLPADTTAAAPVADNTVERIEARQSVPVARAQPARSIDVPWPLLITMLYLTGMLSLLISLAAGVWRLRHLRETGEVSVEGTRLATELAIRGGIRHPAEVVFTSELAVPATFGFVRPTILLPGEVSNWTESEVADAVRHELEHIRRLDWLTQIAARLVCAFYWPHPLVWMAWRRMSLEAERACDDAVLRDRIAEPSGYAEQLVSLARRISPAAGTPALAMARRSDLGRRVQAILDPRTRRGAASIRTVLLTMMVALVSVFTLAPLRAVDRADEQNVLHADDVANPLDTALYQSAEQGRMNMVQTLLDSGANVNAVISGDGTPLIGAARAGHRDMVSYLLDRGADINLPSGGDGNPLIMAAREGHTDVVRLLLDRGADVNRIVPGDENALINASAEGQVEMVRLLIARGADVHQRIAVESSDRPGQREWRSALSMAERGRRRASNDAVRDGVAGGIEGGVDGALSGKSEAVQEGVADGIEGSLVRYDQVILLLRSAGARE
jgi:bla regulator protein BlaR1